MNNAQYRNLKKGDLVKKRTATLNCIMKITSNPSPIRGWAKGIIIKTLEGHDSWATIGDSIDLFGGGTLEIIKKNINIKNLRTITPQGKRISTTIKKIL